MTPGFPVAPRLAGFYFFYFATVGALLPYWSLYLQHRGFVPEQIGWLLAVGMGTKLFAPYCWGWLADHSGRRMPIIRLACLAALLSFAWVFIIGETVVVWSLVILAYSFFWNAVLPQFEVTTLNHLGPRTHRYGRIRLWGSVGFVITAVGMGFVLDGLSIDTLPYLVVTLFAGLWLNTLLVTEAPSTTHSGEPTKLGTVLRQPAVIVFFLVCLLIQASHGPYYSFFTIHAESLGYAGGAIGAYWSWGVVAEIVIFLLAPHWLLRWGPRRLLLLTLLLTALRWLITAYFTANPWVLLFAQTLHGFSFGLYHAVSMSLVHRYFTGPHQGRGQALFGSVGFGLGGALGSLSAGLLWGNLGPSASYLWATLLAMLAWLIAWKWLR